VLLAEREVFTDAVGRQLDGNPTAVENLWPELARVPPAFFDYLGLLGQPMLGAASLDPYLHSIETTESTHTGLVAAYRVLGQLRGLLREFAGAATTERRRELQSDFGDQLPGLLDVLGKLPESAPAARLQADVEELVRRLEPERDGPLPAGGAEEDEARLEAWHHAADELLGHVQSRLREIRQLVTVGPSS
jgi:hypothetical protein